MNCFIDMCIIIFYSTRERYYDKILLLIKNNKDNLITCCYISEDNLPGWIKRRKVIVEVLKKKAMDNSYNYSNDEKDLFEQDKVDLRKLIIGLGQAADKLDFAKKAEKNFIFIKKGIADFMKYYISKKVISMEDIDQDLKSSILNWTSNVSDAKTLASAVQYHNSSDGILIVTDDSKHWTKQNLENSVLLHPSLRNKYKKIPEINYIKNL